MKVLLFDKQLIGRIGERIPGKVVIPILLILLVGNLITISYGIKDSRMMNIFSTDETKEVARVLKNLEKDNLDPYGFFNYGYLYQTVGFYVIKTLKQFKFRVNAMLVALVFRLISLLSYLLAGFLVYKIYLLLADKRKEFGIIAALLFLSIPDVAKWSRLVHPDTFQMCLILMAAWIALSKHTASRAILAAGFAGAAFGTKYSGIFILPFLFLPYFFKFLSEPSKNLKKWGRTILIGILMVLIFLAIWVLTNPYVIKHFQKFLIDFTYEKAHVSRGHGLAESGNPLLWLTLVKEMFGPIGIVVFALGLFIFLITVLFNITKVKSKDFLEDDQNRSLLTIGLYLLTFVIYIMISVRLRVPRYLFPILPMAIILSVYGFQIFCFYFKSKKEAVKCVIIPCLLAVVILLTGKTLSTASCLTNKNSHFAINAGNFLALHEKWDSKILADPYSYVPESFKNVDFRFFIDREKILEFEPDIICLNSAATQRWSWKKRGTSFNDLKLKKGRADNADELIKFHKTLFAPKSPWKIIYETNRVVILKKKRGNPQQIQTARVQVQKKSEL